jgi:hypothetical protein
MQDLKVHASDHSTVSNFGFKYVRSGSGECVRVADDPDLYIGHGKAKVQACEWFEKIVAAVLRTFLRLNTRKSRKGCDVSPLTVRSMKEIYVSSMKLEDVMKRMNEGRRSVEQLQAKSKQHAMLRGWPQERLAQAPRGAPKVVPSLSVRSHSVVSL